MNRRSLADHVAYCRDQVRSGRSTCRELAEQLGFTERAIQACVYGHTYNHIPGALPSPKRHGDRRRSTPLTEEEVREIREEYAAGEKPVREIAERFGISRSYVVRLGRGTARTSIPGGTRDRRPVPPAERKIPIRRGEKHPNAKLDALCVVAIRALVKRGVPHPVIGGIFGTTPENVCMISQRRRWKHVPDMPVTPAALQHLPPRAVELLTEDQGDDKAVGAA